MYLKAGTTGVDKFAARWERSIWLGIKSIASEIVIGTPEGVIEARDFQRHGSMHERWRVSDPLAVCGTLFEPRPSKLHDALPIHV